MRKLLLLVLAAASILNAASKKPKLALFIVVDQCRYDYLTRFRAEYHGGFDRLLNNGAVFTNAQADYFPTLTAVGHASLLTGAMPSATGIIGNDWFDRRTGKHVTSVSDKTTKPVGATKPMGAPGTEGSSPSRLLVTTLGDELRKATGDRSRVIGISIKDRSAILLAGKKATGAYWFNEPSGVFVSSSYYAPELPAWVRSFNESHPSRQFAGAVWLDHTLPASGKRLFKAIEWSPFGNELTEAMAEGAIKAEKLGQGDDPDLLALSFSSTDYVGHDHGPDSPEIHETLLRTDRMLERLFQVVDHEVGLSNVLVVLTSDHGIPPMANVKSAPEIHAGHRPLTVVRNAVQSALAKKYGAGKWVTGCWDLLVYLNRDLISEKKLNPAEVNRAAAEAILKIPHIARAYTREQLMDNAAIADDTGRRVKEGFNVEMGADIVFLPEPYWVFTPLKTTHGSTYEYDSHVPMIFMGADIHGGSYAGPVRTYDIAPTLAEILGLPKPSGSIGRVLTEIISK